MLCVSLFREIILTDSSGSMAWSLHLLIGVLDPKLSSEVFEAALVADPAESASQSSKVLSSAMLMAEKMIGIRETMLSEAGSGCLLPGGGWNRRVEGQLLRWFDSQLFVLMILGAVRLEAPGVLEGSCFAGFNCQFFVTKVLGASDVL